MKLTPLHLLLYVLVLFVCAKNQKNFIDSFIRYKQKCKVVLFYLGLSVVLVHRLFKNTADTETARTSAIHE